MAKAPANHLIDFTVQGEGMPAILIHGLGASREDWNAMTPALSLSGWRTYTPDLLGHGESAKPDDPHYYHMRAFYLVLEDWLNSLQLDVPPLLVGHSLGGYLSIRYALRNPGRIRGLVLIDPLYSHQQISPAIRLLNRRPALSGQMLRMAPNWLVDSVLSLDPGALKRFSPVIRQRITSDYKRVSPHIFHLAHSAYDLTPDLAQVQVPALVIWGDKDLTLRPSSFAPLVKNLPNATGKVITNCGHQPHVGYPELVNPLVVDFASRLLQG